MEKSNNTGKIIGALLVGVAIGGTLGVLFAPEKGSTTRKRLVAKGEDLKDSANDKYDELISTLKRDLNIA